MICFMMRHGFISNHQRVFLNKIRTQMGLTEEDHIEALGRSGWSNAMFAAGSGNVPYRNKIRNLFKVREHA